MSSFLRNPLTSIRIVFVVSLLFYLTTFNKDFETLAFAYDPVIIIVTIIYVVMTGVALSIHKKASIHSESIEEGYAIWAYRLFWLGVISIFLLPFFLVFFRFVRDFVEFFHYSTLAYILFILSTFVFIRSVIDHGFWHWANVGMLFYLLFHSIYLFVFTSETLSGNSTDYLTSPFLVHSLYWSGLAFCFIELALLIVMHQTISKRISGTMENGVHELAPSS